MDVFLWLRRGNNRKGGGGAEGGRAATNFTVSPRSSNRLVHKEESRVYTLHQLEKRGPQRNSAPLRFHLNRVGNDDISSEEHFENSKTRRGTIYY
jgi:hypothetical protein